MGCYGSKFHNMQPIIDRHPWPPHSRVFGARRFIFSRPEPFGSAAAANATRQDVWPPAAAGAGCEWFVFLVSVSGRGRRAGPQGRPSTVFFHVYSHLCIKFCQHAPAKVVVSVSGTFRPVLGPGHLGTRAPGHLPAVLCLQPTAPRPPSAGCGFVS